MNDDRLTDGFDREPDANHSPLVHVFIDDPEAAA